MNRRTFIGTKTVLATAMTLGEYNAYRRWKQPANEEPNAPGYLIEYIDGGKANDSRHVGYISWTPADVFERSYREVGPTTFPAKGAPRVTVDEVNAAMKSRTFTVLPDGRTTVCNITLDNGFTVRGESSCVCGENFDQTVGETIAQQNAVNEVWKMLGFRLADRLHADRTAAASVDTL